MQKLLVFFFLLTVDALRSKRVDLSKPQIVSFVRQNENDPQVVEIMIGTPPQKLKVAISYETFGSTNRKIIDQVVIFKSKRCGRNGPNFYVPSRSKSLRNLNKHTRFNRLYGGQIFSDKIALGSNPGLMQNMSFVIAESKFSCKVAGLWPMDPLAVDEVWEPLLKRKPKPIVTIVADKNPRIKGVWSTGRLVIGSANERECQPMGLAQHGELDFYALGLSIGTQKISFPSYSYPHGYVDLNSDRLQFGNELLKKMFGRINRFNVDCSTNWTVGYQVGIKDYSAVDYSDSYAFLGKKSQFVYIENTKQKMGGRCELKVDEWTQRPKAFKLPAQILINHCVHQQYEVDFTVEKFASYRGWNEISFSKRR